MADSWKLAAKDEEEMEDFHDYEDEEGSELTSKLDDYDEEEDEDDEDLEIELIISHGARGGRRFSRASQEARHHSLGFSQGSRQEAGHQESPG